MINNRYHGLYIAFEGGEGCGKTTQQGLLAGKLRLEYPGRGIVLTREPGGTPKSEEIRNVIFRMTDRETALPLTEAFLFAAARHQNIERTIRPALERGAIVISDRCYISSLIYQGIVRDLGWQSILKLNEWAMDNIFPDLIIYADIDPEIGLRRKRGEANRFEEEDLNFHRKVRRGYLFFAEKMKGKILKVDGNLSIEEQSKIIWEGIQPLFSDIETRREFVVTRERE